MKFEKNIFYIEKEENILEILKSHKTVFIKFSADWCGPCKKIQPLYDNLASLYTDAIFIYIDIDKSEDIATKYNITSLPTFSIIKNGIYQELMKGCDINKLQTLVKQYV
jgi:thiol-disulfide isomerase/thioredoxin